MVSTDRVQDVVTALDLRIHREPTSLTLRALRAGQTQGQAQYRARKMMNRERRACVTGCGRSSACSRRRARRC
eukprot:7391164-Prymnesium_polylepis.1